MDYEKLHKDTIAKLQEMVNSGKITVKTACGICADFVPESEDERIRKAIIKCLKWLQDEARWTDVYGISFDSIFAWLKKQGEQNNNEDADILQRFSFYSYKDEPNVLYLSSVFVNEEYRNKGIGTKILKIADKVSTYLKCNSIRLKTENGSNAESLYRKNGYKTLKEEGNQIWLEKQGEQKYADKVEPKFKVRDKIVENNEFGMVGGEITDIDDTHYELDDGCRYIPISHQDNFKLVEEQKFAWSEEDEYNCGIIQYILNNECVGAEDKRIAIEWFKSLKERYIWKPSNEQIQTLEFIVEYHAFANQDRRKDVVALLFDLKKLREE